MGNIFIYLFKKYSLQNNRPVSSHRIVKEILNVQISSCFGPGSNSVLIYSSFRFILRRMASTEQLPVVPSSNPE